MNTLYVLAHFDDEYFAWPLIRRGQAAGDQQHFMYVADYHPAELAERRKRETERLLARMGVPAAHVMHTGRGAGAMDGAVHEKFSAALEAVRTAARGLGCVDRVVVCAWEGGHPDHDACARLALLLARELGDPEVIQFPLYSGKNLSGRLFRAGRPIDENGPVERISMSRGDWFKFWIGVRHYPSQWRTWLGLWPMMFWTYVRQGFGYQRLVAARALERPHSGVLLYERMFGVSYSVVDQRAAEFAGDSRVSPS